MLTSVTQSDGTAPTARVAGFPVAGKTGTAQKIDSVNGGYLKGEYVSSFAGIIPAQDPQFVIYIAVDQPQKKYYGSEVAAPVFSRVASYLVRKSGSEPVLLTQKNVIEQKTAKPEANKTSMMSANGMVVPQL
jgi:cell division protein FtsI (penicillin-binding protein 3)